MKKRTLLVMLPFLAMSIAGCSKTDDPTPSPTPTPVVVTLESISVSGAKTSYVAGETFSTEGMVVTATYSDKSTKTVTGWTVDKQGALTTADTKVTVTYVEGQVSKSCDVAITVADPIIETISPEEAIAKMDEAGDGTPVTPEQYVKGVVADGAKYNADYSEYSGYFKGSNLKFAAKDVDGVAEGMTDISGYEIVVKGYPELYQGEYKLCYLPASASPTGSKYNPTLISIDEPAPEPELSSITIDTLPTKVAYTEGELFDATGMVVTAHFTLEKDDEDVTSDVTWTPSGNLEVTDDKVTVSYTYEGVTKSAEVDITVEPSELPVLSSITVDTNPTKLAYKEGETFDPTGIKVTAHYTLGKPDDDVTSKVTYSPSGALATTDTAVVVSYTEGEITKTAEIAITVAPVHFSYSYEFTQSKIAKAGYVMLGDAPWKYEGSVAYFSYDTDKGQQFGSGGSPVADLKLSAVAFKNVEVESVKVTAACAKDGVQNLSVKVGDTALKCGESATVALESTSKEFVFTGDDVKANSLLINITQETSKAMYIKKIEVVYKDESAAGLFVPDVTSIVASSDVATQVTGQAINLSAALDPEGCDPTYEWEITVGSEIASITGDVLKGTEAGTVKVVAKQGEITSNELVLTITAAAKADVSINATTATDLITSKVADQSEGNFTVGTISMGYKRAYSSYGNLMFQSKADSKVSGWGTAGEALIYNTTALSKSIAKIEIDIPSGASVSAEYAVRVGSASMDTLEGATEALSWKSGAGQTKSFNFTDDGITFFAIGATTTKYNGQITEIRIFYK